MEGGIGGRAGGAPLTTHLLQEEIRAPVGALILWQQFSFYFQTDNGRCGIRRTFTQLRV